VPSGVSQHGCVYKPLSCKLCSTEQISLLLVSIVSKWVDGLHPYLVASKLRSGFR
jgi:hypothetical protein